MCSPHRYAWQMAWASWGQAPARALEGNALGLLGRPDDAVAVLVAALEVGRLRVLLAGAVIPHEAAALGASRRSAVTRVA